MSVSALQDRVAVVTGAGRGIGRAITRALLDHGARVLATSRSAEALDALKATAANERLTTVAGDLTDDAFVELLFDRVRSQFGTLDVLVNNAGVGRFGPIQQLSVAAFRETVNINLVAAFACMKQAVALMLESGRGGRILNVGSVRSHWTETGDGGAYSASKYGLYALTESVARQFHGTDARIKVGMISPGVTDTRLTNPAGTPRPNFMSVETVAAAVVYALGAPDDVNIFDVTLFPVQQRPW